MPDLSGPAGPGRANPSVLVVVPAWNEEGAIASTIADIRASVDHDVDVLVVDDGSTDETAVRAASAGARVCSLPYNLGVGGAMRTGYRYAVRHRYDVVVQIDADGQHDPRYLPQLMSRLRLGPGDGADLIVGARFAGEGEKYHVSFPRRFAMRLLAIVMSRLARTRLTDVTSGYRVANRRAVELFAAHYPAEYLGDTVESMVIAVRAGCRVQQVPVEMRVRQAGVPSQTPFRAALFLARAVVALSLALIRRWPDVRDDMEPIPQPLPQP
jgi:glycosyltransferase involved in cell wall biosynthesis